MASFSRCQVDAWFEIGEFSWTNSLTMSSLIYREWLFILYPFFINYLVLLLNTEVNR